jgi:sugar/nucleoside kinase (ribokinase family)
MNQILVSGLINIETTLRIDQFPLNYFPVTYPFFGVQSTISGVGFNVAKALKTLGNQINFLSIIGSDFYQSIIKAELNNIGLEDEFILPMLSQTAQSVIIYEKSGRRQIHTDLKDIQDHQYPLEQFNQSMQGCNLCVMCNVNFNRHLLHIAKDHNKIIATDVHAISDPDHPYDREFMAVADILFLSHENLNTPPQNFIQALWDRYQNKIIVVGMGEQGALLGIKGSHIILRIPAIQTRTVINTIGAGDALFSAFLDTFLRSKDPVLALQQAVLFASQKIGTTGAAEGFIDFPTLSALFDQHKQQLQPIPVDL